MATITNAEVVDYLGLPQTIITELQTAQGTSFATVANQFLDALVNKIVYQTVEYFGWEDPFRKYDGYPINYGETAENIFIEAPNGYTFDKDATDPFTKYIPDAKTLYATINYEMQYPVTIQDSLLRRAALNEYGFMNIINSILASVSSKKNLDTYFATLSMLNNETLYADGFEDVDLTTVSDTTEQGKVLTQKIVDVTTSFQLPSTNNNAMGVMTASNVEDILLIIRRDLYNKINLDYLTGVYNLEKVDLIKKIMVVESFQVKGNGGQVNGQDLGFVVLDTRGFDNHVALEDGGMIYNPKGKYTNHFQNLWKIISFKYFFNARAFMVKFPVEA